MYLVAYPLITTPHTMYMASLKKKLTIRLYPKMVMFLNGLNTTLSFWTGCCGIPYRK